MIKKPLIIILIIFSHINIIYSKKPFVVIYPPNPKKGETLFVDITSSPETKIILNSFPNLPIIPIKISAFHRLLLIPISIKYAKNDITFTIQIHKQKYIYSLKVKNPFIRKRILLLKRRKIKRTISKRKRKQLLREAWLIRKARKLFTKKLYIKGSFIYPIKKIIQQDLYFGDFRRIIFADGEKREYHQGIDFAAPWGTNVYASNDGRVIIADNFPRRGKTIIIDHGYGILTEYIHLSKIKVRKGQYIRKGQLIGKVGSTGFSTGPHLHWGLSVNGVLVNPLQWTTPIIGEIFKNGLTPNQD